MLAQQRVHIDTVLEAVGARSPTGRADAHDEVIRRSWQRCVEEHRLDPTRMQEAVILPDARLREHQDQMESFIQIARHGLEQLYQQVAGLGYCVLLTDARGVTVDFLGDLAFEPSLRKSGLYLGADWSEAFAGTCGVGTCIATGEALTVHLDDHFDATHIPLTCTTAPVFDALGALTAVLDISALTSPQAKESQRLALQLVKMVAGQVENASFLQRFRGDWILRLSTAPQFLEVHPQYLLALDAAGRVIGHNRAAQLRFSAELGVARLIGMPFERVFDAALGELGRYVGPLAPEARTVALAGGGRVLFMLASPPPTRNASPVADARQVVLPAPLAALSGGDALLDRQIERAARLVNSPVSLLLTGETGSGKEFFAKAVHESSARRRKPFVAVNCAAIPESLIESELFGYLPGSFSGAASKGKRGLIQAADGGTLFLDEIGDMPLALQARLLRVLAEREVLPIGAMQPQPVDIRVIAATHCDLVGLTRSGRFRDDLYYRLNGAQITLPPLRKRADLGWMIDRMLALGARDSHDAHGATAAMPVLSPAARARLMQHAWPGNLRELRNVIEYARSVCRGGRIELDDLPDTLLQPDGPILPSEAAPSALPSPAAPGMPAEAAQLLQVLRDAHWNVTAAARTLGLARMTLYRRMKRWGIQSPNQTDA